MPQLPATRRTDGDDRRAGLAAVAAGLRVVCSTDAHSTRGLANMPYAVATARRGGATAADVVNTRPLESVALRR